MNHVSLIARGGRPHLIGGQIVSRRDLVHESRLALLGPRQGRLRSSLARVREESCRVPSRDAFGLENVGGKMFAVDGSSEVDVTVRFRRHHAGRGRPRGPHPGRHDEYSKCADLRGEWQANQSRTSSAGLPRRKCSEQHITG
jgi:hypothetical protein